MITATALILSPLIFLLLPDRYWDILQKKTLKWSVATANVVKKITGSYHLDKAQVIISELANLEASSTIKFKTSSNSIPRYKFYTDIINSMLQFSMQYGSSIKNGAKTVRHGIAKDHQFERKILKEHMGGIAQFVIITTISWSFFIAVKQIMAIEVATTTISLIIFLQISGATLYLFLAKKIKDYVFKGNSNYLYALYVLKSLIETGLPIQNIIKQSKISELFNKELPQFKHVNRRVSLMIERVGKTGAPVSEEISEILDEIWFIHNTSFENFIKKIMILKFFIIAGFYLTSYFLFLLELFNNLL